MRMIQITDEKKEKLSSYVEKVLHYAGKMMQCVENLESPDEDYGERYGSRMGMRDWDNDDDDRMYGERRRRNSRTGRYM